MGLFFLPFQGCVNKPTSSCRVALCDRVIRGFWFLPSPGPPRQSPGPPELLAAALKPLLPPLHLRPLSPLSAQGMLASLRWVDTGPGSSGKFLSHPVIIIWGDPRARVSTSQKAVWSFLGTWSPGQRQGHSQAQGWSGGGTGNTRADQSPLVLERTGNVPFPILFGELWAP